MIKRAIIFLEREKEKHHLHEEKEEIKVFFKVRRKTRFRKKEQEAT